MAMDYPERNSRQVPEHTKEGKLKKDIQPREVIEESLQRLYKAWIPQGRDREDSLELSFEKYQLRDTKLRDREEEDDLIKETEEGQ